MLHRPTRVQGTVVIMNDIWFTHCYNYEEQTEDLGLYALHNAWAVMCVSCLSSQIQP